MWQILACVASVSNRVIARKLEWKRSLPNFLNELARKRLLRRLGKFGFLSIIRAEVIAN